MDPIIAELLPAIEEQLASPDTPYVADTFDHLINLPDEDISPEEAKQMIAFCLADEIDTMATEDRPFNPTRYQLLLKLLPTLPEGK